MDSIEMNKRIQQTMFVFIEALKNRPESKQIVDEGIEQNKQIFLNYMKYLGIEPDDSIAVAYVLAELLEGIYPGDAKKQNLYHLFFGAGYYLAETREKK